MVNRTEHDDAWFEAEWDLLKALVDAGNADDMATLCRMVNDPRHAILDKPRCIQAAISAITLVRSHIEPHYNVLLEFVSLLGDTPLDIRSAYRKAMLDAILKDITETRFYQVKEGHRG